MRGLLALCAVSALLVSCSDDGAVDTTSTSLATTPSTSAVGITTTTTQPPSTTAPLETTTTLPAEPEPDGSGCTPGTDDLPDGRWYGLVDDFSADGISFDLVCWFSNPDATVAATEDGEESPPPNDYYVRNDNDLLRVLSVDESVPVTWYPSGAPDDVAEGTFSEWTDHLAEEEVWFGIWVTVSDGRDVGAVSATGRPLWWKPPEPWATWSTGGRRET